MSEVIDIGNEAAERQAVIAAARTWLRTPFRDHARVKGAGVDCLNLLIAAHVEADLVPPEAVQPGYYPADWHMHRDEERYADGLERYMRRVDQEDASINQRLLRDPTWSVAGGDVILVKYGRTFSHAAIVTRWPMIIHAYLPEECVTEGNVLIDFARVAQRPCRVYSWWRK